MHYLIRQEQNNLHINSQAQNSQWVFEHLLEDGVLTLLAWQGDAFTHDSLLRVLDQLFSFTQCDELRLAQDLACSLPLARIYWQASRDKNQQDVLSISRAAFYQIREIWLGSDVLPVMPLTFNPRATDTTQAADAEKTTDVPKRPNWGNGTLYQRYIPQVETLIEIRRASIEQDGERFHRWQNDDRVARFWEYPWTREQLDAYLQDHLDDPHTEPLIVSANGQPFAYVESYWCREDRLGAYYDNHAFDQGYHLLIGEPEFQGELTHHFLTAVSHFLFLTDPRTEKLMGEPRADNKALLKHVTMTPGWHVAGEVRFPHKLAALLRCDRDVFFNEARL